jgi:hypothetical protein
MTRTVRAPAALDNRPMSAKACCPNCWTWSEIGTRTTCRRCGASLILSDGRRLDEVLDAPPPPPPPPGAFGAPALASPGGQWGGAAGAAAYPPGPIAGFQAATRGTDWVEIARWITIGYGTLTVLALIGLGLLVQHINVPITDPTTGIVTIQTFDIGAPFAIAAVIVGAFFALFAWLTQYTAARVIFLVLDVLAILSVVSRLGPDLRAGTLGILSLVSLAVDVAYGVALLMSLISPPPRQRDY